MTPISTTTLRYAGQLNPPAPREENPPRCCPRCRRGVVPGQFPCAARDCRCHQPGGANHPLTHQRRPIPVDGTDNVQIVADWIKEHS